MGGIQQNKAWLVCLNGLKRKVKSTQVMFFTAGLPVMLTLLMYAILSQQSIPGTGLSFFDVSFPGFVFMAAGIAVINTAIHLAGEKKSGMLERFGTLPIGRRETFVGFLLSETIFMATGTLLMFGMGYGILQLYFANGGALMVGLLVALLFGMQSVGIGILFAAVAKSPEAANGCAQMYIWPVLYASGALVPFESPIVYAMPAFWGKQVFLQLAVYGHGLADPMYSSASIGTTAETIGIPLWGGLGIFALFTVVFLALGIVLFQRKARK